MTPQPTIWFVGCCRCSFSKVLRRFSTVENLLLPGVREQIVHELFTVTKPLLAQPILNRNDANASRILTVGTHPINGSDGLKTSTAVLHRVALLAPYAPR